MREVLGALEQFFDYGGVVLYLIFFLAVVLWTLLIERLWYYMWEYPRHKDDVIRIWEERGDKESWEAHKVRDYLLSRLNQRFSQTLPLIKIGIALCPLFGLLGTVTGMIEVFDVMAVMGTTDARAMASGVSKATVPTMAGMFVAIVSLLAVARYESRIKAEIQHMAARLTR